MKEFVCQDCRSRFPLERRIWRCPCGGILDIDFTARFPWEKIKRRKKDLWRYWEALPLNRKKSRISLGEGFTPLELIRFNDEDIHVKREDLSVTGSFKDRGAAVLVSKVKELGIGHIIEDSSGNAGAAISAYASKAGIKCEIIVPADIPNKKLTRIRLYNDEIDRSAQTRQEAAEKALSLAESIYYASHSWNPFFLQGVKTIAFEIREQMAGNLPDEIYVPVGNGTLLLGTYLGFLDLLKEGIIARIPRLIAVQSENCAPLHHYQKYGELLNFRFERSLADGISIARPVRLRQILEVIKLSQGKIISVSESEIEQAWNSMMNMGYQLDPTAAVVFAAILKRKSAKGVILTFMTGRI